MTDNKNNKKFLPFALPSFGREEETLLAEVLRSGWVTTGPQAQMFEQEFAKFIGVPGALALSSCTAGLHLALAVLGIKPGDRVITTPLTFCAGVNVIEHMGAIPVLADVEPDTLNIDPEKIRKSFEAAPEKPKAVIAVHLAGHPCDMDPILDFAHKNKMKVVEDAAHALPAKYKGRFIGTTGDLTAFSFYATKNLATAEGGMLTGDPELLKAARELSLHGMSHDAWKRYDKEGSWKYDVTAPGFKYNLPDVLAALGLVQLKKLNAFQARRREIVALYNKAFSGIPELQIPVARKDVEHAWHLYVLRLNKNAKVSRDRFIEEMKQRGIGTSVHFIPVHLFSYYVKKYGFKPEDFPVAFREYQRMVSLPLYPGMSDADVARVTEAVLEIVKV